jgi:hypothetical protein
MKLLTGGDIEKINGRLAGKKIRVDVNGVTKSYGVGKVKDVDGYGNLVFTDAKTGGERTIRAESVKSATR